MYTCMYFKCTCICLQTMHPHICTEPTGFIIAVGSDPEAYKGSQISLPPPELSSAEDRLWEGGKGGKREKKGGKEGRKGEKNRKKRKRALIFIMQTIN